MLTFKGSQEQTCDGLSRIKKVQVGGQEGIVIWSVILLGIEMLQLYDSSYRSNLWMLKGNLPENKQGIFNAIGAHRRPTKVDSY